MKPLIIIICCLTVNFSFAQETSLSGQLIDSEKKTLPSATVMLINANDSTMEKFSISGRDGNFTFKRITPGDYLLQVSFIGFQNISLPIQLIKNEQKSMGQLVMETQNELLENVTIEADRIPIVMKKDTIEYNADAFATKPGASVEDLLKKLPGVEVEKDGTIKAQGVTVNKVLVDGKEFFGNDPQLATKNLPADAMDKVQIFDKMSELSEFTGVDDGSRDKTINLSLKEDKKNGLFGNVEGGYGNDDRYKGKLNLNQFTKKQQLSFIGSSNNINEQSFSLNDYISLSGGLSNMMSGGGGGELRLEIDEGLSSALGLSEGGIRRNWSVGTNLNKDLSKKTEIGINYFFNDMSNNLSKSTTRQNFNGQNIFGSNRELTSNSNYNLHRLNTTLKHKFNDQRDLILRNNIKYTINDQGSDTFEELSDENNNPRNTTTINNQSITNNFLFESSLLFRQKFSLKGRSLAARLTGSSNSSKDDTFLNSATSISDNGNIDLSAINQEQNQNNIKQEWGTEFTYTEPILNGKLLQGSLAHRQSNDNFNKDFFDIGNNESKVFNDQLSADFNNSYQYTTGGVKLFLGSEKSKLTIGINGQQSLIKGDASNVENILNRKFFNLLPSARWQLDLKQAGNLSFNYNTGVRAPNINQLQPVVNNANPFVIFNGNPNLNAEYSHTFNTSYSLFDQFSLTSIFLRSSLTYTKDKITNQTLIDDNFRQVVTPVNVDQDVNLNSNISFSTPLRFMKSKISISASNQYSQSLLFVNNEETSVNRISNSAKIKLENRNKEIVDAGAGIRVSQNITKYLTERNLNQEFFQHAFFAEMNFTIFKKWNIGGDFSQENFSGNGLDNATFPLLTASVSRTFLKLDRAELKLSVFDALNKNQGIFRSSNFNFIEEERVNVLTRYLMLSFRYKLSKFKT